MIRYPLDNVSGIFGDKMHFAGHHIQPVNVEALRIALVHPNQDFVVEIFEFIDDLDFYPFERRDVSRIGAVLIDSEKMKVLVATKISCRSEEHTSELQS